MYHSFKDMPVWQDAMDVAERVHKATEHLPRKEDYGLTSQIRRSALSISANIAEAFGRKHLLDKINFYYHARGSLTETQNHIEYSRRVGYLTPEDADSLDGALNKLYLEINKIVVTLKELQSGLTKS
ncbi:four helix bundle protein [Geomonas sp. Red69]|uniref:Four helix bundle protein n=1 Tax=Geomonas diazotrophica TaxID=2843197 RepID=A0ABX8JN72_9BACT|nr:MULTISPECIES: four helix bundle protein [Geomonas]MBU5635711.1 four helix bundle protein [Geomonas diazotrophica]QWV98049.1 four helix bundle protein [Geomonas nitrogeniifigens]QXE87181.1 four helix bundle protein [Geomonas nitrogeniifigens]